MNEQDCARCFTPENVAEKRPRTSPTLQTPCRPAKRTPLREKVLNSDSAVVLPQRILHQPRNQATPKDKWSDAEIKALIEFVLFHSTGDKWPSHKQDSFWSCASDYLRSRSGDCSVRRSGQLAEFIWL